MSANDGAAAASAGDKQLTFNIKASTDAKHAVTVPETMTVAQLKEKLSTAEYANVEASRQRLIYSGRVMKDHEPLSAYNIKDGNTVHLVKGAASNQQRNPTSQNSSVPNAGVPQNIAAGTGHDPLAGLTGARYAGYAQMPGAEMFGPDGGMGGDNPERMLEMLEDPMLASQMNEAMNNPEVIRMLQNSPMVRDNPMLREMINNPDFRRQLMDPNMIRQSMQLSRMMRGMGGQAGMPAPGVTDTTPGGQQQQQSQQSQGAAGTQPQQPSQQPAFNPMMFMGQPGAGLGSNQQNPFAALFGMNPAAAANPSTNTEGQQRQQTQQGTTQSQTQGQQETTGQTTGQPGQQMPPFMDPFSFMGGQNAQGNPIASVAQQMMQNPEMMRQAMQMMGMGGGNGAAAGQPGANPGAGAPAFNPFAMLGAMGSPPAPQDTRPPEEQYAEQLRQLNDMGFFEFERNVRALRMSGGRVEGAIEMLLSGNV